MYVCLIRYAICVYRVAEQRRKRLKELELQISDLKKKMTEQTKLLRMKDTSDKQVNKLNTEILVCTVPMVTRSVTSKETTSS